MNATNDRTTLDRTTTAYRPSWHPDWTEKRAVVRDICVERAHARFLAARWLELLDNALDSPGRALADATRTELQLALRRYTQLLLELGERRGTALSLVGELATEVAKHQRADALSLEDLREELVDWVSDVAPRRQLPPARSPLIAD